MRRWVSELRLRIDALRRSDEYEAGLEEEFLFHIEQETAENVRRGMDPDEARRVALVAFGGVEYQKERFRDQRGFRVLDDLSQDFGHARRSIRRHPGTAAVIIVVAGAALGVVASALTVADQLLGQGAPYLEPDRLVLVRGASQTQGPSVGTSWADFWELRERVPSLASVAVFENGYETPVVLPGGRPALLSEGTIGLDFLDVLGLRPAVGRPFTREEHLAGQPVVMITHRLWENRFDGSADVIDGFIELGGESRAIVGVLPRGLEYPMNVDFVTPERDGPPDPEENLAQDGFGRSWRVYGVVGRLSGTSAYESLAPDLDRLGNELAEQFPATNAGYRFWAEPFEGAATAPYRSTLMVLMLAAVAVLLIATVNVTSLLVSRGLTRSGEIAIRLSLGGGRARILRQLLIEGFLYAVGGGIAGILIGALLLDAVVPLSPWVIPGLDELGVPPGVLGLCLLLAFGQFLIAGVVGAYQLGEVSLSSLIRTGSQGPSRRTTMRIHEGLVGLQVASGTLLMLSSLLVGYSYLRLQNTERGFDHDDSVLSVRISLQAPRYTPWDGFTGFFHELLDSVAAVPEVSSSAISFSNPVEPGRSFMVGFEVEGVIEPETPAERLQAAIWPVSSGFFETLGLDILQGRPLHAQDGREAPGVVVVNQAFVDTYLDGVEPIGLFLRKSQFWDPPFPDRHEIVGVARNVRVDGARTSPTPAMFFPYDQTPFGNMRLLVRGRVDAASLAPRVREAVWSIDPQIPLDRMAPIEEFVSATVARERFMAVLIVVFAAIALALSASGLFTVASRGVASRRTEYGIRRAMGATRGRIFGAVLIRALRVSILGWLFGLLAFVFVHAAVVEYLFQVGPFEPWVHLTAAVSVIGLALGSAWWPARRALAFAPATVLRDL